MFCKTVNQAVYYMNKPVKQKTSSITIHYKIWLESALGEGIMGDGKWRLLEAIDEKGSLSAASIALNISYRKAWGDLKKAEALLGTLLIDKQRGGAFGGTTNLTEYGKKYLALYKSFHKKLDTVFNKEFEAFLNEIEGL